MTTQATKGNCGHCGGTGKLFQVDTISSGSHKIDCSNCKGTGNQATEDAEVTCPKCDRVFTVTHHKNNYTKPKQMVFKCPWCFAGIS